MSEEEITRSEDSLAHLTVEDLFKLTHSSACYIHEVPMKLRVGGEDKFQPQVVSIGPYHHNDSGLAVTRIHKKLYLRSLIADKPSSPEKILELMTVEINKILTEARACYAKDIAFTDKQFGEMLVLDGCFILELMYRYQKKDEKEVKEDDVLFNKNWVIPSIRRDLVLLENQIPFQVLRTLLDEICHPNPMHLNDLIGKFFSPILPTIQEASICNEQKGKHLLDLLRHHLIKQNSEENHVPKNNASSKAISLSKDGAKDLESNSSRNHKAGKKNIGEDEEKASLEDETLWVHTACATDLQKAGVKFERKGCEDFLLNISFKKGKFEIPPFYFGESWTVLFPNMIALEQCRGDYPDKITSYVFLMDNLIESHNDVKLLRRKRIISGSWEEDETIADVVNILCKKANYTTFYYDRLCKDVNTYRKDFWPRTRHDLKRNYFGTLWSTSSVIAAVILLLLALIQTLFSMFGWKVKIRL